MDIKKSKLYFPYNYFFLSFFMHSPVLTICENIAYVISCLDIARSLQYFLTILVIDFEIFWQSYNISQKYFYNIFKILFSSQHIEHSYSIDYDIILNMLVLWWYLVISEP